MNAQHFDVSAIIGLVVVGAIAIVALFQAGDNGELVASAAVGGICGWLARSGTKTANIEHADTVQGDGA